MPELWRNAIVLGSAAVIIAAVAAFPRGRILVLVLVGVGVAAAFGLDVLDPAWALGSLGRDAPWTGALILAAWSLHAGTRWTQPRAWWSVVLTAALLGDVFVALGLAVCEPDPRRRARLVLAASGASLIGVTGGAAPLLLGWGGIEVAALGALCAAVGFVGGGDGARVRPSFEAGRVLVPVLGAVATWLVIAGGGLEFAAMGLESLPIVEPRFHRVVVAGAGALAGVVGDEGVMALYAQGTLDRALSLRTDETRQLLLAGLAVGGGLPLLLLTRSSLRVGLPLWAVQVLLLLLWASR